MEKIFVRYLDSPIGRLRINTNETAVLSVSFSESEDISSLGIPEVMNKTLLQLEEYFLGKRKTFDLPLAPAGSDFQQKIWTLVVEIPFGKTASYLDIARASGSEKNTRAVGLANGRNPIPIIIPCHRVIATNGKLTGYAGGLERKRWLLRHELENSSRADSLF